MTLEEKIDILLVDDKPENLLVLDNYLDDLNLNCIKATSGKEALGISLERDLALILLDVQMPEMDGFETAELLRSVEKTRHIPIIFVTAISKEQHFVFKGYEVGAVDYLFKPFAPEILRAKVRIFLDLHRKKQALVAEIAARKKTEENLALFRCLIDRSNDAIFIVDPETGSFLDTNRKAAENLGYSRNEFLAKKLPDIDSRFRESNVLKDFSDRMGHDGSLIIESVHEKMDGSTFPVEMNCKVLGIKGRKYLVVVSRDITERKSMEEALKRANEGLEAQVRERTADLEKTYHQLLHAEKLSALGKLCASIAHEINNPLFGIRNVLGGVQRRANLDAEDEELVAMALDECDRVKHLIQNLKDFKRPTRGIMEATNLHDVLESTLLLLRKEFKNKKIKIVKQYAENLPTVRAVGDQIKQVLLNLFHNAADAMADSTGTITITTAADAETVAIHIRDTGTGIRQEDLKHIFEPFFTTKPGVKGTGLGLSVSYGIIKQHKGKIEVKSEAGKGSVFSVTLPMERDE